eukprot:CAMPEP_0194102328 /NCGR_PEP_ID=MMETSP0150-20130528/2953_1 /TAXON_ID=122233 /ORGANISM="Chaetoceros debilis, Strain MM31A-1" /LENGTH=211 /DNA_ID=CAMNT_0038789251 /DNA_START=258 /DNA_END=890 /DNA_ORIENTATION=-
MNLKQAFTFAAALTCLAPNIFVASAAQIGGPIETPTDIPSVQHEESRCTDSPLPLILLVETTGGSSWPVECKTTFTSKNTWCSETGVLSSHCPKACGMCQLYKCSDSKGTFLMQNGCDRDCSWLQGSSERRKRIECKRGAVAKTCRATCNFCDSDDTAVTNKPSTELGAVPSAVPSFDPSLVPSAVPSNKPSLVPTNAPSVQLSNPPSREL